MVILHQPDGCISISDGSKLEFVPTILLTTACILLGAMFSVPLVGVLFSKSSDVSDLMISLVLSGIGWIIVFFVIRIVMRSVLPWRIQISCARDHILIKPELLFITWAKRISRDCSIVLEPAYQRGDWGYTVWLNDNAGKRLLILRPTLISSDIEQAKQDGIHWCREISKFLGLNIQLHKKWGYYSNIASKMGHGKA